MSAAASKRVQRVERFYVEAVVMGLLIGLAVLLLQSWLGAAAPAVRLLALLVAGGLLCLIQYGMARLRA